MTRLALALAALLALSPAMAQAQQHGFLCNNRLVSNGAVARPHGVALALWNMGGNPLNLRVTLLRPVAGFQPDGDLQAGKVIQLRPQQNEAIRIGQAAATPAVPQGEMLSRLSAALQIRCE